jgi:hypothetical protein
MKHIRAIHSHVLHGFHGHLAAILDPVPVLLLSGLPFGDSLAATIAAHT